MSDTKDIIEAIEFRVVDAAGRVRLRLGMIGLEAKTPGIELLSADGNTALTINLEEGTSWGQVIECPHITLHYENGLPRLILNVAGEPPYPGISLSGTEGKPAITLVVPPDDEYGEISLADAEGNTGWSVRGFENKIS